MKASTVDLRYHMKDVLKALDRNEPVEVLYRGKVKGVIIPKSHKSMAKLKDMKDHPLFGMIKNADKSVDEVMQELRGARHNDI